MKYVCAELTSSPLARSMRRRRRGVRMPLIEYFFVVGVVLTALLFVAERYFPAPPAEKPRIVNTSSIRIKSVSLLPDKGDLMASVTKPAAK